MKIAVPNEKQDIVHRLTRFITQARDGRRRCDILIDINQSILTIPRCAPELVAGVNHPLLPSYHGSWNPATKQANGDVNFIKAIGRGLANARGPQVRLAAVLSGQH